MILIDFLKNGAKMNEEITTNSEIESVPDSEQNEYDSVPADSNPFYEYITIADPNLESYNVVNIPNYVPYFLGIIFGIGILSGLFFSWVSAWKQ